MASTCTQLVALGLVALAPFGCGGRQALERDLAEAQARLAQVQAELVVEDRANDSLEDELAVTERQASSLERKVAVLERELRDKTEALGMAIADRESELAIYNQLANALQGLIDAGTVQLVPRKGKMLVEIQESILFPSGQAKLTVAGKRTLVQVTQALASVPEREFMVAGHTDDVPIRSGRFRDNLELSTERASNVLRFMVQQGFPSKRLSAAGYGAMDPLESNDTPEGRAKNRRIDIILVPDLTRLFELGSPPAPPP